MVMMRSALSATSAGQSRICEEEANLSKDYACNYVLETRVQTHTCAPESWSSLQDSEKTSVAMTGYPCLSKFLAMGVPMLPTPMKPTGVLEAIDLQDTKTHT